MDPASHDFTAYVNTVFDRVVVILDPNDIPADITGSSPRMEVRAKCADLPILTFDEASGTVTDVDLVNGQFRLNMPSGNITEDMIGSHYYDLALFETDANERVLIGSFEIKRTFTEEASP